MKNITLFPRLFQFIAYTFAYTTESIYIVRMKNGAHLEIATLLSWRLVA